MSIDIETIRARNEARRRGAAATASGAADIDELLAALDQSQVALRQLTEECADLHASAQLWADLYSASVERTNAAEERHRRLAEVPANVQRYYGHVDAVAVLTEALEALVRDCVECAAEPGGSILDYGRERWCGRCLKGIDALRCTVPLIPAR